MITPEIIIWNTGYSYVNMLVYAYWRYHVDAIDVDGAPVIDDQNDPDVWSETYFETRIEPRECMGLDLFAWVTNQSWDDVYDGQIRDLAPYETCDTDYFPHVIAWWINRDM